MARTDDVITADDLEWEQPTPVRSSGGGKRRELIDTIGHRRGALHARRGQWAVLDTFEKRSSASSYKNRLGKIDDPRLVGIELAGRSQPDGGSKLYVRAAAK